MIQQKFFSLSLTKDLYEKVAKCAEKKGMSKADIHRIAISKFMAEEENEGSTKVQNEAE